MPAHAKVTVTQFEASPAPTLRRAREGQVVDITANGRTVASLIPSPAAPPGTLADDLAAWQARHPAAAEVGFPDEDLRLRSPPRGSHR